MKLTLKHTLAAIILVLSFAVPVAAQKMPDPQTARQNSMAEYDRLLKEPILALPAWEDCLIKFARVVSVGSDEPAEVIARASFTACLKEENLTNTEMLEMKRRTSDKTLQGIWEEHVRTDIWPALRKAMNDRVIAAILVAKTR
jgi:hypothetical protein